MLVGSDVKPMNRRCLATVHTHTQSQVVVGGDMPKGETRGDNHREGAHI